MVCFVVVLLHYANGVFQTGVLYFGFGVGWKGGLERVGEGLERAWGRVGEGLGKG